MGAGNTALAYTGQYLWPPRPEGAIPEDMISFYQQRGWWAQIKKNGTCTLIFARGGEVRFRTRYGDAQHKDWTPLRAHTDFFRGSPEWQVFVAELVHSKTPHIKNQLYIFDLLVLEGEQLIGSTFAQRQGLLHAMMEPRQIGQGDIGQYPVHEHVTIAKSFISGFQEAWRTLKPEDEGLVFKKPDAKLVPCWTPVANASWQAKCRRSTKNHAF